MICGILGKAAAASFCVPHATTHAEIAVVQGGLGKHLEVNEINDPESLNRGPKVQENTTNL